MEKSAAQNVKNLIFAAEEADAKKRLDVFLAECLADAEVPVTRSGAQKLIGSGAVTVNGAPAAKKTPMRPGDVVRAEIQGPLPPEAAPEDIPLDVLYEDGEVIVINKPQGMVVHPAPGHASGTVVNALLWRCGGTDGRSVRGRGACPEPYAGASGLSGINGVLRPGIVHRIDRDTSGVIVIAKTDAAHQCLARQLACHSMHRVYLALVNGVLKNDVCTIDAPVGRSPKDRKKMAVTERNSRRAVTYVRVLERFPRHTLIEARLETGRTHQIRVHMAHIGHPVVGDPVYGRGESGVCGVGLRGQMLHAGELGFVKPGSATKQESADAAKRRAGEIPGEKPESEIPGEKPESAGMTEKRKAAGEAKAAGDISEADGKYVEFRAAPPAYFQEALERLRAGPGTVRP
ncbi:MAG: RluA family pseudouridine synthase [Firmicutes bacterium]|nr:RluA family pseudouridine synthase [Bacillota bacterium]